MPRKYYKIELTDSIEIHVYFETVGGYIVNFAVKLILKYDGIVKSRNSSFFVIPVKTGIQCLQCVT